MKESPRRKTSVHVQSLCRRCPAPRSVQGKPARSPMKTSAPHHLCLCLVFWITIALLDHHVIQQGGGQARWSGLLVMDRHKPVPQRATTRFRGPHCDWLGTVTTRTGDTAQLGSFLIGWVVNTDSWLSWFWLVFAINNNHSGMTVPRRRGRPLGRHGSGHDHHLLFGFRLGRDLGPVNQPIHQPARKNQHTQNAAPDDAFMTRLARRKTHAGKFRPSSVAAGRPGGMLPRVARPAMHGVRCASCQGQGHQRQTHACYKSIF
jgi:hypothetical protein